MSARSVYPDRKAADRVIRWCDFYTRDLPRPVAAARRDELISDLYEEAADAAGDTASRRAVASSITRRALRGTVSDLTWRNAQFKEAGASAARSLRPGLADRALLAAAFTFGVLLSWAAAFSAARATEYAYYSSPASGPGLAAISLASLLGLVLLSRHRTQVLGAVVLAISAPLGWWFFIQAAVSQTVTNFLIRLMNSTGLPVELQVLAFLVPCVVSCAFFIFVASRASRRRTRQRRLDDDAAPFVLNQELKVT